MIRKILLIENNQFLGEILETNLQVYLNAQTKRVEDLKSATEYLEETKPNLIISKDEINEVRMATMLLKSLEKKQLSVPLMIIGREYGKNPDVITIEDPMDLKSIVSQSAKLLGVTAKAMSELNVSKFYPVHSSMLIAGFLTPCNVYLKKGESFELLAQKDEKIVKEIIDELKSENILDVYVNALDRLSIINALTTYLFSMLRSEELSTEARVEITEKSFQLIQDTISKVGIDPHTAALAEASIDSVSSIVEKIPTLKSLLESMREEDQSYRFRHSMINTYVGFKIITQTRWGNKEQQDKFAFVSFFHDISLTDDDHARVANEDDLKALNLPPEEANKIRNHALNSAKIVSKYRKLPFGVDTIIKQHHGARDGKGFENISANISPLAIMFILSEEWTKLALVSIEKGLKLDKGKILSYLKEKYNLPKFKKFIPLLEKLEI